MDNNTCKLCAKPIDLEEYIQHLPIPKIMAEQQVCFNCAFWIDRIKRDSEARAVKSKHGRGFALTMAPEFIIPLVIDGQHQSFSSKKAYGGKTMAVLTAEGELYFPTQMYYQGIVPEHFREELPDNAILLNDEDLQEIKSLASTDGQALSMVNVPQNVVQKMFDKFYKSK